MAEASATAEPETPENTTLDRITTCDSPLRMCPTSAPANANSRAVTPPVFMSSPARKKNGMAR